MLLVANRTKKPANDRIIAGFLGNVRGLRSTGRQIVTQTPELCQQVFNNFSTNS